MNYELKKKLSTLGLEDLLLEIEEQENNPNYITFTFNERIEIILNHLYEKRYNDLVKKLIRLADFKYPNASIDMVDYELRGITKETLENISKLGFINSQTNIIITGLTGSGKTYLSNCLGIEACKKSLRTYYIRVPNLSKKLDDLSNNNKEYRKYLRKLSNYSLLILDEWLIYKLNEKELRFFYELFEMRCGTNSTIFISQYTKDEWHERLGGGTHADSIMDRIVHNSYEFPRTDNNLRELYDSMKRKEFLESIE